MGRIAAFHRSAGGSQSLAVMAILLVLGGMCILVAILVGQILSEGRKHIEYYEALERSIDNRTEIQGFLAAIQDAEAGQREFLLTGRQEFLGRYEQATRSLPGRLQALETRISRTSLEPAVRRIAELVPVTVDALTRAITKYQQGGPAAAAEIVAEGSGREHLDNVRAAAYEALTIESKNINQLSAEVREQAASSRTVILILFGGVVLAMVIAGGAGLVYFAHRRRTEKDLRDARRTAEAAQKEAEQANRAKSEFLSTMSHEIRTPLHAVIGTAELLLENNTLSPQQREYVDRIQVSGTALLNVVNDVLDLTKIEAGEVEIVPEPFSLETLIDNSISIVRTTAVKKGMELSIRLDHGLPLMLLGDEARLRQVLLNLLGNAVKFTDHGQIALQVEHRGSTEAGKLLRFSVTDTGPGIPESKHERLFRRFSQISQSAHRSGGTGLGLAISKQLVELMGGEMGFESAEGRGSTFWFSLTLPQVEAEIAAPLETEYLTHEPSGPILVVDDLDQNRDLARKMLEAAGYTVDEATNGAQAVSAVQATTYELVLMDVQMDRMDGVTATKVIRNLDHPAKDVPIIAMTANVLADDVRSFKAAGMNDHLGKPFKRKQLLDKVVYWLHSEPSGNRLEVQKVTSDQDSPLVIGQETIDEICSTMGREWFIQGLTELKDQLGHAFQDGSAEAADRDVLARQAHMLVARAGILGFPELSQLCSAVEQACRRGEAVGPPLARARAAALQAQAAASQLLRKLNAETPNANEDPAG